MPFLNFPYHSKHLHSYNTPPLSPLSKKYRKSETRRTSGRAGAVAQRGRSSATKARAVRRTPGARNPAERRPLMDISAGFARAPAQILLQGGAPIGPGKFRNASDRRRARGGAIRADGIFSTDLARQPSATRDLCRVVKVLCGPFAVYAAALARAFCANERAYF